MYSVLYKGKYRGVASVRPAGEGTLIDYTDGRYEVLYGLSVSALTEDISVGTTSAGAEFTFVRM